MSTNHDFIRSRVTRLIDEKGLTKTAFASKIGISPQTLNTYLQGRRNFGSKTIARVIDAFQLDKNYFRQINEIIIPESRKLPVIPWARAATLHEPADLYQQRHTGEWIPYETTDRNAFALKVRENSMEADFRKGDIIVVSPARNPKSGDCVVSKYGGEVVFRLYRKLSRDSVALVPLNPSHAPVFITGRALREFKVIGVVVGMFRKLA